MTTVNLRVLSGAEMAEWVEGKLAARNEGRCLVCGEVHAPPVLPPDNATMGARPSRTIQRGASIGPEEFLKALESVHRTHHKTIRELAKR